MCKIYIYINTTTMKNKTALIIVDLNNDFMPGGALGVDGGLEVVPLR